MEESKRKIRVLWIDDEPSDSFLDEAYDNGLVVEVRKTVKAGLKELQNKNEIYEAIILDANCKIEDEDTETPQLIALANAIVGIYANHIDLPWFVYTGGAYEGRDALEHIIPRDYQWWESKQWYNKPDDINLLFNDIKKAIADREDSKIKFKYRDAFRIVPSAELLDLLKHRGTREFSQDYNVPTNIRIVCENLCDFLKVIGVFPAPFKSSNKIKACSLFFSSDKEFKYVPSYIQSLFFFLNTYSNEGSHAQSRHDEVTRMTRVREDIKANKAIHLNTVGLASLLSLIEWAASIPVNDPEEMKPIHLFFSNIYENWSEASVYENIEGIIEKDDNGIVHCKECVLHYKAKDDIGKLVKLHHVANNDKATKDAYPFYAKYVVLDKQNND